MLDFLSQNLATIIISLILIVICALIIFRMRSNKKQGKSSCGYGCSACAMKDMCHSQNKQKTKSVGNALKKSRQIESVGIFVVILAKNYRLKQWNSIL